MGKLLWCCQLNSPSENDNSNLHVHVHVARQVYIKSSVTMVMVSKATHTGGSLGFGCSLGGLTIGLPGGGGERER